MTKFLLVSFLVVMSTSHFIPHVFFLDSGSIDSDGGKRMSIKVDGDTWEVGHVDHVNQICLARLNLDGIILAVIDQACIWDWGLPGLDDIVGHVGSRLVVVQKCGHLFMVPVRESHCHLFVEMVGEIGIVNDEGSPQTVWVLALSMRVVPIGARLLDLVQVLVLMLRQTAVCSLPERNR